MKLKVYETFAGIGAQHKAITNIKSEILEVGQTSEWDARAIISYALIHNKTLFNKQVKLVNKWTDIELDSYLNERTFSLNSKTPGRLSSKKRDFKIDLISANIVNNNKPDITKVGGENLENVDLLTYSFPCQGLSVANMTDKKGMSKDSNSTSNLIWEIYRILTDARDKGVELPKYLLMENVPMLLSSKYISDYTEWVELLSELGYTTNTKIINGINHNSTQSRKRVFGISIMNGVKWSDKEFDEIFKKYERKTTINKRQKMYENILVSSDEHKDEIEMSMVNNTKSRISMGNRTRDLKNFDRWIVGKEYTFNTLTCKQDRFPNVGMVKLEESQKIEGKLDKRLVTPREAYRIMGFANSDYDKIKPKILDGTLTKESVYRQAGNSIVVSVLEDIFRFIEDYETGLYKKDGGE